MKNKILTLILSFTLLASFTGCATMTGGDSKNFVPAAKTAAYIGTFYALKEHPEWRDGFMIALRELQVLEQAEKIDFTVLLSIVNRLPVDELKSPEATLIVTSATILLSEYGGQVVNLDQLEQLRPVVAAIRQGMELGLK